MKIKIHCLYILLKAGPGCAICKLLVQEIDQFIAQNKSASEINATVYDLCNKLPSPLNTLVSMIGGWSFCITLVASLGLRF